MSEIRVNDNSEKLKRRSAVYRIRNKKRNITASTSITVG
jgi:hypothetical protein